MADNNKLKYATRMLCSNLFCCLLFFCLSVDCAIYSFNNKYSNQRKLASVDIGSDIAESSNVGFRFKRDLSTSESSISFQSRYSRAGRAAHGEPVTGKKDPKIEINRVVLNGTVYSYQAFIHWIGKGTSERIFILTCRTDFSGSRPVRDCQLWISEDYGDSFAPKSVAANAKISYIYTFDSNPKKLVLTDVVAKSLYRTDDELMTIKVSTVEVEPDILLPHPTDENKLLLYSRTQRKLYVSVDFAGNWTFLADNVLPNFFWGVDGFDETDLVHMEIEGGMTSQAFYKACIIPDCKPPADKNLAVDWPFVESTLVVHNEYVIVRKSNANGSENYLAVSYKRQPFQRAYFPGDLKTDNFILLNLDDGQIFVAVKHENYVNLYLSDVTGQYFVLSFEHVYHSEQLGWLDIDFHEVKGMNWTFIVNKKESPSSEVVTYISFDKGGNWAPLMLNKNCTKPEDCSLLLQVMGIFGRMPIVSMENAPGLILAHGTVGTKKKDQPASVFTSNDGGATWIPANITGMYHLNILNQGSILTAIPDGSLTGGRNKTVFYSCDAGNSWKSQLFDSKGLNVKGVLTEPGIFTTVESVFGHEGLFKPWTHLKLNFSSVLNEECGEKDYEDWYPQDYNVAGTQAVKCLLGSVVAFRRRKVKSVCYNKEKERITRWKNMTCQCTSDDYECDFGYEETGNDCKKAKWFDGSFIPKECDDGDTFLKSKGYRKVPADTCTEDDTLKTKYDPVKSKCITAAPTRLTVIPEAIGIPTGKEMIFHLDQAGGSKWDTVYTWNFGDSAKQEKITGFSKAKLQKHIYHRAGHFNITVVAENTKGRGSAFVEVHVQDPIRDFHIFKPYGGKTGIPVNITLLVQSDTSFSKTKSDHAHFVWTFGDEKEKDKANFPILTWNNSMSHVYEKAGNYKVTVEAVNSFSSAYREFFINIFDDAEVLELSFDDKVSGYNLEEPTIQEWFSQSVQKQLAEDLGVNLNRLESVVIASRPVKALLYIFPSSEPDEENVTQIKANVMNTVKTGTFEVFLGFPSKGNYVKITAAENYSDDKPDNHHHPNMKAVYIAVPVLVLAVIVSVVSFIYCRRKLNNIRQYNILHAQDDSDTLLDDDEPPLDLNVDFGARESFRDDAMLDSGGSQLVMVTGGGGSSDNAESC